MSVCLQCILEREIPGVPMMEGKTLAMVYCGTIGGEDSEGSGSADIIAVDFGGSKRAEPLSESVSTPGGSILAPLEPFIAGAMSETLGGDEEWHEAAQGLAAVAGILEQLRAGATVTFDPDFEFGVGYDDPAELTEALRFDLEELAVTLQAAQREGVRFYLAFDV